MHLVLERIFIPTLNSFTVVGFGCPLISHPHNTYILNTSFFNFLLTMNHYRRNHIPAFGSWDCNDDLPFTQCFESARQAGLIRYSGERDLYVAGDLYENNIVTPAIIVAPRRREYPKKTKKDVWVEYDSCDAKEPPPRSPVSSATRPSLPQPPRVKPKAVDEDLYKISPELLRVKPRRKRWGLFSSCVM